jgi:hypothetical protein
VQNIIIIQEANTRSSARQHRPPTNAKVGSGAIEECEGRIRYHGRVSILCWRKGHTHRGLHLRIRQKKLSKVQIQRVQIRWTEQTTVNGKICRQNQCVQVLLTEQSAVKFMLSQTYGYTRVRIRCHGGVRILCWQVTPSLLTQ